MANKKNIKVRDLKPSKDAKGGGAHTLGAHSAGSHTAGAHSAGSHTAGSHTLGAGRNDQKHQGGGSGGHR